MFCSLLSEAGLLFYHSLPPLAGVANAGLLFKMKTGSSVQENCSVLLGFTAVSGIFCLHLTGLASLPDNANVCKTAVYLKKKLFM